MEFKDWLLSEKAERTSSRVPLYPPQYHTKQYLPTYHAPYAADYNTWLHLKLEPYTWQRFQNAFGHEKVEKPTWPVYQHNTPYHAETIGKNFKWSLPGE